MLFGVQAVISKKCTVLNGINLFYLNSCMCIGGPKSGLSRKAPLRCCRLSSIRQTVIKHAKSP